MMGAIARKLCVTSTMMVLATPQAAKQVTVDALKLVVFTDTLMFTCVRIKQVAAATPQPSQPRAPELLPCRQDNQQHYWGVLPWQLVCDGPEQQLPDFGREVLIQQAVSAAGISLPMHGCGAVGHASQQHGGLYTSWMFCEGCLLTRPWARELLTQALAKNHTTSCHQGCPVGIICLARPDVVLSEVSLVQARWLAQHSKVIQAALTQTFQSAVEHGYVHLAADQPSSVAVKRSPAADTAFHVYLINWSAANCAERVRIKPTDQKLMQYLLEIPQGVIGRACRQQQLGPPKQ